MSAAPSALAKARLPQFFDVRKGEERTALVGFAGLLLLIIAAHRATLASRAGARFGQRRALGGTVAIAVLAALLLFFLPPTHTTAIAVYVLSGIIGSIVARQFWTLVGDGLTVAQGRRLFGLISSAGVVGGMLGSGTTATALNAAPVTRCLKSRLEDWFEPHGRERRHGARDARSAADSP
jgi:MFS family permease